MTKDNIPTFSEDDINLWERVTQTIAKITHTKHVKTKETWKKETAEKKIRSPEKTYSFNVSKPKQVTHAITTLNIKQKKKLKKGQQKIDKVIDLHGYTIEQAYNGLINEITQAYNAEKRYLLIITGKGMRSENKENTLKRHVPSWLSGQELRPMISATSTASKNHGGEGALYVVLKKKDKEIF